MITVDYRESSLLDILKEHCISSNLIHGDIMISIDNESNDDSIEEDVPSEYVDVQEEYPKKTTDKPPTNFYIIERKTLADLSASIKESRFREQKSRLISVYPSNRIIYIIENSKRSKFMLPEKTLRSAIINLSLKHNFSVFQSKDTKETVEIILDINSKLLKGELITRCDYGEDSIGYTPITKSSVVKDNYLACQLATIPGVSRNVALLLMKEYKCMKNLLDNFTDKHSLEKFRITEKRCIGPKLSEKIFNAFHT